MTIPEAVRLILHAGAVGRPGDVHVLNMGQPIRITDLAKDLIRLSAPAGGRDIQISFTGLRPGEKLEETLFGTDEAAVETESPFLLIARPGDGRPPGVGLGDAARLEALAEAGREEALRTELTATAARGVA
jgi:FlaA1/EpsC-like NDP-sugar epimerase